MAYLITVTITLVSVLIEFREWNEIMHACGTQIKITFWQLKVDNKKQQFNTTK